MAAGVEAVSLAVLPPLAYAKTQEKVEVPGYQPQPGESLLLENNFVSSDYFATLGIPILEGRPIDERDRRESEGVMVIETSRRIVCSPLSGATVMPASLGPVSSVLSCEDAFRVVQIRKTVHRRETQRGTRKLWKT
jgi:hypothetical protein